MFNILAQPQGLASQSELLLDGFKGRDQTSGVVRSVQVPGVEPGEILKGAQKLVSANYREISVWEIHQWPI